MKILDSREIKIFVELIKLKQNCHNYFKKLQRSRFFDIFILTSLLNSGKKGSTIMARKTVAPNISYDDVKKRYYVTISCGVDRAGNRVRQTKCFPTLEQAQIMRDTFLREKSIRGQILPAGTTLGVWLNYWLDNVIRPNRAVTTTYGYEKIIENHIKPALGNVLLCEFSAVQLQQYMSQKLAEGLSNNTIRKHHVLLNSALSLAVKQEMLSRNVVQGVAAPPKTAPHHTFYSAEQLQTLFTLAEGTSLEPVVKLAGYLGMRRSEICGLKWDNVDLQQDVLYICEARTAANGVAVDKGPKSVSSVRRLAFAGNEDLREMLRRMDQSNRTRRERLGPDYNPSGYVVTHSRGLPYAPDYLSGHFTKFVQRCGLPPCTLHGLRHSFASIANQQKVPMFSICKALGHSNTAITSQIYMHLFDDTHQEVVDLVGQAIHPALPSR